MTEIALYMHAGSGNHGCEAIVDSLVRMMPLDRFILMTNSAEEDERYLPAEVKARTRILEEQHLQEHKAVHIFYYGYRKLTGDGESFLRYRYRPLTGKGAPRLAVSIGGDNYCYANMTKDLMVANAMFNRQGTSTVLLGCSIEPELLGVEETKGEGGAADADAFPAADSSQGRFAEGKAAGSEEVQRLREDLHRYRRIIARESISYHAIRAALATSYGREAADRVVYCPDPAFFLPADESGLPKELESGNTVGINLSPMIEEYAADPAAPLEAYAALIREILSSTRMKVALIPHVVWERSNDRTPLKKLYEQFADTGRVLLVPDMSAEKLKGVIANCRFFIGARTHATIAAYSTIIPTLVVGYSVKARGIARDLFGTEEHYVLPVQELREPQQLLDAWHWLLSNEDGIRCRLAENGIRLRAGARGNAEELRRILQEAEREQ